MPLSGRHAYSATTFLLELQGAVAASLLSVEGGEAFADVVSEPPAAGRVTKHLGAVRYAPVTITFGSGIGKGLLDWIAGTLAGQQPVLDGAVVFLDYQSTERTRLEFKGARVTVVELPLLDAASKERAALTVTFQPESTAVSQAAAGTHHPGTLAKGVQKQWLASNFRFTIAGLETACAKVMKVEPLVVRRPADPDAGLDAGPLEIKVPDVVLNDFRLWHEDFVVKGNNGDDLERSARLVLLAPNRQEELFSVNLGHLGIVRIKPERLESNAEVISRSTIELYVETVELDQAAPADFGTTPTAPPEPTPAPTTPAPRLKPTLVADRLLATAASRGVRADASPRRVDGEVAGETWARTTASLHELETLAALDGGEWTALRLDDDHSLGADLRAAGALSADAGAADLGRDAFTEGLVAGAARVYREVLPQLALEAPVSVGGSPGAEDDSQLASVDLQNLLQKQQQALQMLSNISKELHDSAEAIIRKLAG